MACNPTLFLIILCFIFNNTNADSTTDSCNFLSDNIYIYLCQGASGMRYLSNEACDSQTDLSLYARNS